MNPHEQRIKELLKKHPEAKTKKFRETVREAVRPTMVEEWGDEPGHHTILNEMAMSELWVRPDAYLVVPDAKLVVCWEVEYRHRYTSGKYNTVFWFLDEFYWRLKVITVDAVYGGNRHLEVFREALDSLEEEREEAMAQQ